MPIIIAEAGVNHNGDYATAVKLIEAAKAAGADYVKFQTAVPEEVISVFAPKAEYQKETTGHTESQLEMCRKIHLPLSDYAPLKRECELRGIKFLSTPFDLKSIDLLAALGMDCFKIPSGEIDNLPYLRRVASKGLPVILSTGMSTLEEIKTAILILTGCHPDYPCESSLKREDITVLHCNTQYPTPFRDVNLKAMLEIRDRLGVKVGYSDHTVGIEVPIAATAIGAEVIEKHFTLSRQMEGPDHKASLEPDELREMVEAVHNVSSALGDGHKRVSDSERPNIVIARKSIVAARAIEPGEVFSADNITTKRPGAGLSPLKWDALIGKKATRSYKPDEPIAEKCD